VLLIFILPVIHNLTNRRFGHRGHLYKVKPCFLGHIQCIGQFQNTYLFPVLIDDPDLIRPDSFVDGYMLG